MRIHRLMITAFGPFGGTEEIDLDGVAASGLFLVHGPTGAGKSSILDAICFALYANVPGHRPGGDALHSHHAPADAVPTVELEFTAAGRRLRVRRSPTFRRPKKRGDGETRVQASVELSECRNGSWAALSSRNDEVAEVVDDVLAMGLAQFAKVVLLPQGDFAAFLRATVEDRRRLLERLFDVTTFTEVEAWLAEERRTCGARVDGAQAELRTGLARLGDVLARVPEERAEDVDLPRLPDADVGVGSFPGQLDVVLGALETFSASTIARQEQATARETTTRGLHREGLAVARAREKGVHARRRLREVEGRADEVTALRDRLSLAARADAVHGDLRALQRAEDDLARFLAEVTGDEEAAATLGPVDGDVAGLREREGQAQDLAAELSAFDDDFGTVRRVAATMSQRSAGLADAQQRAQEVKAEFDEAHTAVRAKDARIEALRAALAVAHDAAADVATADAHVADLTTRVRHRRELGAAESDIVIGTQEHLDARAAEQEARSHHLDLREARLAEMSGELADDLEPGSPCPVCGSCQHPAPAVRARTVTSSDTEEAEAHLAEAVRRRELVTAQLTARTSVRDARLADLRGDGRSLADLTRAHDTAQELLASARRRADERASAEDAVARAEKDARTGHERVSALRETLTDLTATANAAETGLTEDHAQVERLLEAHAGQCPCAEPRPGEETSHEVHGVIARHEALSASAGRRGTGLSHAIAAAERVETARVHLSAALAGQGFRSADEARGAVLPIQDREQAMRRVSQHETDVVTTRTILEDDEVVAALAQPAPDIETLEAEATRARLALTAATREAAIAEGSLTEGRRHAASLRAVVDHLGPSIDRHTEVSALADLVSGAGATNALRMRLSAYVLAARLERIVDLANERLSVMGDGRFRLKHYDGHAAHGARSGLGLLVQDLWTGRTRDTATLSGGESFMASLALALGLADAVREESGGFDLETLFVDEGFGSLDEDSLEDVMAVLDSLRDGGRAVGVVSHVPELRTRIPHRLVVRKTPDGSTVSVVTDGGADETAA